MCCMFHVRPEIEEKKILLLRYAPDKKSMKHWKIPERRIWTHFLTQSGWIIEPMLYERGSKKESTPDSRIDRFFENRTISRDNTYDSNRSRTNLGTLNRVESNGSVGAWTLCETISYRTNVSAPKENLYSYSMRNSINIPNLQWNRVSKLEITALDASNLAPKTHPL